MRRFLPLLATLFLLIPASGSAVAATKVKLASATTTTATTTASTSSGPSQYFGFNDNSVAQGQLTATQSAQLTSQDGANVSRLTFDWRYAEPSAGNWRLGMYDSIYNADLAKGEKPIFILLGAPQWTWADPTACGGTANCWYPPAPAHLDAWRDAVTTLLKRYPQMAALEIWNEPNLSWFWSGPLDPAYYTQMLSEAYSAAKATGSTVPILGGAVSDTIDNNSTSMSLYAFIKAMYADGAKGHMDGLSIHPYADDIDLERVFKAVTDARTVRDAAGDSATPIWATETGISTTNVSSNYNFNENDQAFTLSKIYTELAGMKDVKAAIFHTIVDPTMYPVTSGEYGYGFMHADLTPKPVYCSFAKLLGTSYVCPSNVPAVADVPLQKARWQAQDYVQEAADAARSYFKSHGGYAGMTTQALHAIDPKLSATPADGLAVPGPGADPSRVGVWVWGTTGSENVLLCNTSQADRSYCIETHAPDGEWTYGSAVGTVNTAAGAITNGAVWWW